MKPHERHQEILTLLRNRREMKVSELCDIFDVSEGTIRNDLDHLATNDLVTRFRGGASLVHSHQIGNPVFAERARKQASQKMRIARWASDMVNDGEAIFLDASTTAFHMCAFLRDKRHLTVITCGIETALALAEVPTFTVILMGGVVRPDRVAVAGDISGRALEGLHIRTAFMSCAGFTVEAGLTDSDIQMAQLKRKVVRMSEQIIGLLESSKFGAAHVSSFAGVDDVAQILTDNSLDLKYIDALRDTNTILTICGDNTTRSYAPYGNKSGHIKVGFASLSEDRQYAVEVRRGLEQAAQSAGHIDLIIGDNQFDSRVALRVAERLVSEGVDLAIEYHFDEKVASLLLDKFNQAGIPVIAVDTPMVGATYFGVDNYRAGWDGGVALGDWIKANWEGRVDKVVVLEHSTGGPLPAARITGQFEGLCATIGAISEENVIRLDDENAAFQIRERIAKILQEHRASSRLAVISLSDNTVEEVLKAAHAVGKSEHVICVAQGGGTRFVREELRKSDSRIAAATLFRPEKYGEGLVELAERIMRGEKIPPAVYVKHEVVDRETLGNYYVDGG